MKAVVQNDVELYLRVLRYEVRTPNPGIPLPPHTAVAYDNERVDEDCRNPCAPPKAQGLFEDIP